MKGNAAQFWSLSQTVGLRRRCGLHRSRRRRRAWGHGMWRRRSGCGSV